MLLYKLSNNKHIDNMFRINNIKYSHNINENAKSIMYSHSYINSKKITLKMLQNIRRFTIDICSNDKRKIVRIPINIIYLSIGYNCNIRIKIPINVTHLYVDMIYIYKYKKIPQNITHLYISNVFSTNAKMKMKTKIPQNIIYICFHLYLNSNINFNFNFNITKHITMKIPQNIKKICIYNINYSYGKKNKIIISKNIDSSTYI